jgi:glucose uptake protein
MILPTTASAVWILVIVSLLCLGSWANTLKLAGKWRFEYFYFDFVLGILLCAGVAALALGSGRPQELTVQDNLILSGYRRMAWAIGSGVILNLGMLLLVAVMTIAGMSVAFPLTLGVALVIGVVWDFANATQANMPLTFMGVALLVAAVILAGLAYVRLLRIQREAAQKALTPDPRTKSKRVKSAGPALVFVLSVVGGIALSAFPKILGEATGGDNGLAPYSAMLLLSVAALISSPFFVLFFMTFPVVSTAGMPSGYLAGSGKQHLLGLAGGILLGVGMLTGLMATVAPQEAQPSALIQYALNNGALLVAAAWGLLAWQEFRGGGDRVRMLAAGMLVLFLAGLGLVAYAFFPK